MVQITVQSGLATRGKGERALSFGLAASGKRANDSRAVNALTVVYALAPFVLGAGGGEHVSQRVRI